MSQKELPKVNCKLVGQDGNAFYIMGRFQVAARKTKGWTGEDIQRVLDNAMSGDYNHLLATIASHCKNP